MGKEQGTLSLPAASIRNENGERYVRNWAPWRVVCLTKYLVFPCVICDRPGFSYEIQNYSHISKSYFTLRYLL
jgi:hypothetical protein